MKIKNSAALAMADQFCTCFFYFYLSAIRENNQRKYEKSLCDEQKQSNLQT